MTSSDSYAAIHERVTRAAERAGHPVRLLAVSKTKPARAVAELARHGQRDFGENYVQEALAKQREVRSLLTAPSAHEPRDQAAIWHLIGPLQSNKCREVAEHFDWLQSLDREKLIAPLNRFRPEGLPALNVLVQVNIDDETSKSGCHPDAIDALADAIGQAPRLRLRGLMAIPQPHPDLSLRRDAFRRMRALFERLRERHFALDSLSLGMSDDFELAIEEGATMVRVGTALFGKRET